MFGKIVYVNVKVNEVFEFKFMSVGSVRLLWVIFCIIVLEIVSVIFIIIVVIFLGILILLMMFCCWLLGL